MQEKPTLEVCLTPQLYAKRNTIGDEHLAVVIDVLRATSTLSAMASRLTQPIKIEQNLDKLQALKAQGYKIVSEREGCTTDFADYANDPILFLDNQVDTDAHFAFSSTNGGNALYIAAADAREVVLGAFLNWDAVVNYVKNRNLDTVIMCSGFKGNFSLEDTLFAGALCDKIINESDFSLLSDSTVAALTIWQSLQKNYVKSIQQSEHYHRLQKLGMGESAFQCLFANKINTVAQFKDGYCSPIK
ncbi:MAG: 2-phosphosulfolactate phosphatase [Bacteroidales bacterium]|jgi:2-phosphosulfolactate phosphatase|nr:2-phosphosulfolactate phosphatase [Bacteroidales bacterium]